MTKGKSVNEFEATIFRRMKGRNECNYDQIDLLLQAYISVRENKNCSTRTRSSEVSASSRNDPWSKFRLHVRGTTTLAGLKILNQIQDVVPVPAQSIVRVPIKPVAGLF